MPASNDNLGRKEALVLLYLADELPAVERVEVDSMLASDVTLRAMYDELRGAEADVSAGLARVDAAMPVGDSETQAVVRRTLREMKQWQADRLARRPAPTPPQSWRPGWRSYTAVAAAAILAFGLFVWLGSRQTSDLPPEQLADGSTINRDTAPQQYVFVPIEGQDALADDAARAFAGDTGAGSSGLAEAEGQFDRLQQISDLSRAEGGNAMFIQ